MPAHNLPDTTNPTVVLPPALRKARLTSPEASQYLALAHGVIRSPKTLDRLRCTGGGPRFQKLDRSVLYTPAELDAWVSAKISGLVGSTSEADVQATE